MVWFTYSAEAPPPMPSVVRQAAAIPLRGGAVCMVTSRSGRRWVLPKGRIEAKQSPAEAAAAEAWEEAGLLGRLEEVPVGVYEYEKLGRVHRVMVFVLHVESELSEWPEQPERTREWLSPEEAIGRIEEPELRGLLAGVCGVEVVGVE